MSKIELQRLASEASGVSLDESVQAAALSPSLYERFGSDCSKFKELSTLFYNRVFDDKETSWFLSIFSSSTRSEAIENQYKFFVQTFGGPDLYRQAKGKYTRLVGRHANYNIGHEAANQWVAHMDVALASHSILCDDDEARDALHKYFLFTAHYIVVASEYMRPDQVRMNDLTYLVNRILIIYVADLCLTAEWRNKN